MGDDAIDALRATAATAGIRHLHIVAWRDLADVEAGGSEVYVARLAERYAAAGMEVFVRTSYAQGHRPRGERDGYQLLRRAGRKMPPGNPGGETVRTNIGNKSEASTGPARYGLRARRSTPAAPNQSSLLLFGLTPRA